MRFEGEQEGPRKGSSHSPVNSSLSPAVPGGSQSLLSAGQDRAPHMEMCTHMYFTGGHIWLDYGRHTASADYPIRPAIRH